MANPAPETHLRPYDHNNGLPSKQNSYRRTNYLNNSSNNYYKQNSPPSQRRRNFNQTTPTNNKYRNVNTQYTQTTPTSNNNSYQKKYNNTTYQSLNKSFEEAHSNTTNHSFSTYQQRPRAGRFALVSYTNGKYKHKQSVYNSFVDDKSNIYRFFKHSTPYLDCDVLRIKDVRQGSTPTTGEASNDELYEDAIEEEDEKRTIPHKVIDEQSVLDALTLLNDDDEDDDDEVLITTKARYLLSQLWNFYDVPYGLEVPFVIRNETHNVYFVPHLSAMQLFHDASQTKPSFEFFETSTPDLRFPLIDKIEELSVDYPFLTQGNSSELDRRSWYSIAWYPILCHNETMNWMKGQLITYHHFEPHDRLIDNVHYFAGVERSQSMEEALMESCMAAEGRDPDHDRYYVPVIGFLPYKIRNDTWFTGPGHVARNDSFDLENGEDLDAAADANVGNGYGRCLQAPLYLVRACKNMMYEMQINHPDYQHVLQNFRELAQV